MHRIDTSTATSDGLFTEGDPLVPTPATVVSADWLNSVQEELATIVTNAGLELQKADNTQVLTAILQIIARQSSELERLRLLKIGCPMYWRSTTLPENFAWVNGDLILFEDRPEFKEVYLAGGFEGMLLEANATSEQIAANLGKFRKHPNGLGLYLPSCGEQFFRAWTGGSRAAGSWQGDAIRELSGRIDLSRMGSAYTSEASPSTGVLQIEKDALPGLLTSNGASEFWMWGKASFSASRVAPTAEENRPLNIALPVVLYLGIHA
jgi:hypothetical protein